MHKAGGIFIVSGDESSKLLDQRNCEVSGQGRSFG